MEQNIPEIKLQKGLHSLLSDPSQVRMTASGKRLQVLSPGSVNVHEGPDLLDIAILLEGNVYVGDAEFHKYSSDWLQHKHQCDERYKMVILHIVMQNDVKIDNSFETLVLTSSEQEYIQKNAVPQPRKVDMDSLEELQHYALLRLLRKTSEAQRILNTNNLPDSLTTLAQDYINRYNSKRKRPVYTQSRLQAIVESITQSHALQFLEKLATGYVISIPDMMQSLIKTKFLDEGSHIRRELVLNSVLPLALCLASKEARINLFLWYWSTPALNTYGILKRRFKELPQNYLWQQQGMLEYMQVLGRKSNVASDILKEYGFAEILSFYKLGSSPYSDFPTEEELELM